MNTISTLKTAAGALILIALASGCASGLGRHDASIETLELQMARGSASSESVAQAEASLPQEAALRAGTQR